MTGVKRIFCCLLLACGPILAAAELRIIDATPEGDAAVRQLAMAAAFTDPELKVSSERKSAEEGFAELAAGKVDIVLAEVSKEPEKFDGTKRIYAVDTLAFYVNVANSLERSTLATLYEIFSAEKPNWGAYSFLTDDIRRIGVKTGNPGAGRFDGLLGKAAAKGIGRVGSTAEMVLLVSADPAAIGFGIFLPTAPVQVRMLEVDGVAPTLQSVAEGKYPLSFKRAVFTANEPNETVKTFLAEFDKADFRDALQDSGLLPAEK